jgi:hypothetical protein
MAVFSLTLMPRAVDDTPELRLSPCVVKNSKQDLLPI